MTPKVVSVTRVLNEDDVIEAFVRHNIRHVDEMIFLDNGSTDNTLPILRALKEEGLPIIVLATQSLIFDEVGTNTRLYGYASQIYWAGWVAFLDADEFLAVDGDLLPRLKREPHDALALDLVNYHQTSDDDGAELIIPVKQRWRTIESTGISKILLRGGLTAVRIEAGNHGASADGRAVATNAEPAVALAHYPERDVFQALRKAVIGWLKILAVGRPAADAGWSGHYEGPFNQLRDAPAALLRNSRYLQPRVNPYTMENAPLRYLGGELRYTAVSDPALKAVQLLLDYIDSLARQYRQILDMSDAAKELDRLWNAKGIDRFRYYEAAYQKLIGAKADLPRHLDSDAYYSAASDQALKALRRCLRYAELLARRHGRLLDEVPEAKTFVEGLNAGWERLI